MGYFLLGPDGAADQGSEPGIAGRLLQGIEAPVLEVADARREAGAEQMAHREDLVGVAFGFHAVLLDVEASLVVNQAVEDVDGLPYGGVYDLGAEGGVLVGDVSVEYNSYVSTVAAGVDLGGEVLVTSGLVALVVGGRGGGPGNYMLARSTVQDRHRFSTSGEAQVVSNNKGDDYELVRGCCELVRGYSTEVE